MFQYKIILITGLFFFIGKSSFSQYRFTAVIKNDETHIPVPDVSVEIKDVNLSAISDDSGQVVINNIPAGRHRIIFSHIGFSKVERSFSFPIENGDPVIIYLEPSTEELEEITVNSTRINRTIQNTPTRVEVIGSDEIKEEAEMQPGDVRMLLSETTGIQAQQTSATSASAGLRIQGLDGRYTQILKDGFPLYAGAATGLGILQIPPLDLRQVEIIKGSSSTLYGGGAIAGMINLISKVPQQKRELTLHGNFTSGGGIDLNGYYSEHYKKTGITFFAARNSNKAFDPADISFSAIPKFERYTINPKLFIYPNENTTISLGVNSVFENRLGGDMLYIEGKGDNIHSYFERNKTQRISTQLQVDRSMEKNSFSFRNSVNYFNRVITARGYMFKGIQHSTFNEATYVFNRKRSDWVTGLNFITDDFDQRSASPISTDYHQNTTGAFVQNTWNATNWLTMESGLRADHVSRYGSVFLPRLSLLFRLAPSLTSRVGGGLGYKSPTIFTEETERLLYKNVLPVSDTSNRFERSYGVNADVNYKTSIDELSISINQFFFFTIIDHPLFLQPVGQNYKLVNLPGHTGSKGGETNVRVGYNDLTVFLGYTFIDSKIKNNGITLQNPLTPKHRFNSAIVYEVENKWRLASEIYYFSKQKLTDGSFGRSYWLTGFVAERNFKNIMLYINFENIGDVRQTRFENIYSGTVTNPVFRDIYAPLEGFIVNGGIRVRL